jgi:hypothetical protein
MLLQESVEAASIADTQSDGAEGFVIQLVTLAEYDIQVVYRG